MFFLCRICFPRYVLFSLQNLQFEKTLQSREADLLTSLGASHLHARPVGKKISEGYREAPEVMTGDDRKE